MTSSSPSRPVVMRGRAKNLNQPKDVELCGFCTESSRATKISPPEPDSDETTASFLFLPFIVPQFRLEH
eukprot:scaffold23287_cov175-Amphora_coffeaeformis.AAC.10